MDNSLPADLAKLQQQFEHWRSTRSTRSPIPEDLLQAARALLGHHSTSLVCRACRLHPSSLRKPATVNSRTAPTEKAASQSAAVAAPVFFSLPSTGALPEPLVSATDSACRLMIERPDGARLTLTIPPLDAASLSSLCSGFLRS
jgi:hypothetical protein